MMIRRFAFRKTVCSARQFSSEIPEMPLCDFIPEKYVGTDYVKMQDIRNKHIAPCIATIYKKPLLIHQGHMQWLFNHEGKRYLDMFAGVVTVSVGHCHPKVVEAASNQMKKLWHTTNMYLHPTIHDYAEKLTSKLPGDLKVVYLVNSGSEANDLAMLIARLHTGNHGIISLRNGYHGMTNYTMGLTAQSTCRYPVPSQHGVYHTMNADPYRGIWGGKNCRDSPVQTDRNCECQGNECNASDMYYGQLEEVFKYSLPKGRIAGMFAESIQGLGGCVQYPHGFLKKAEELIHINGGLFISDEVQTGFGRTGDHFWGFEAHGVSPDIVTMAKGIGNGFPFAALVTTPKIAECLTKAMHFNTYGGNPIACAAGIAVLDVMEEEKTQQLSKNIGTYLLQELAKLKEKYPVIGDVRGKGLMIGIELVQDEPIKSLSLPHVLNIVEDCKDMGLLLGKGGLHANVLRIKPPMCITKEDADFTIKVLDAVFKKFSVTMKRSHPDYQFLKQK